jgi:hypothetical protein
VARTIYECDNASFSNRAHKAARSKLYPQIFNVPASSLEFEDTLLGMNDRAQILDGEMGVDRIVRVSIRHLRAPLVFTVQERFRRPAFAKYKDLTVTEWNHASNLPSELYKINAGLFVYGYYDELQDVFTDAIAISVTDLLLAISRNRVNYHTERNRKEQTFLAFDFKSLESAGVIRYWLDKEINTLLGVG